MIESSCIRKGKVKGGVIINIRVVMTAAKGIVMHDDANLIADGGPITITKR